MLLTAQLHANPRQNHLLAALNEAELAPLLDQLELVSLQLGDLLYEPGVQLTHAYFPSTCIISLYYLMKSGASAKAAGIGNEGMLGLALVLGGNTTSSSAVVLTAGQAWRLDIQVLLSEFKRAGKLQALLLRYTQALMTQMMQTAVCNTHHSVEQRLCRWLLLTLDRMPSSDLVMTQELVASMLGVRREGVTEAAGRLQNIGLIRYRRGHITVLDRVGLESVACECYGVLKTELIRLQDMK